jgi:hypothetical protein
MSQKSRVHRVAFPQGGNLARDCLAVGLETVTVTHCGRPCFKRRKVNLSQVFAGQNVGVTQVGDGI